jgi:hypothetical protein
MSRKENAQWIGDPQMELRYNFDDRDNNTNQ